MVRDWKDVALGSYEASQVYCFNFRDRAEEREVIRKLSECRAT